MKFKLMKLLSIVLAFAFITGCSMTKEEAIDSAIETFEAGVTAEPQETNQETELFNYFLPSELKIEETNQNNLVLSRGNNLYLIFSNPAEDGLSKVNYEHDKAIIEENTILMETLETEETFSYFFVLPFEDDEYKIIVGSGGQKGTTISDIRNINSSVETIIEIIRSISYKQE